MRKRQHTIISYPAVFKPAVAGGYTAAVPELPGCISEGNSFEEARQNIAEAISLYLEVSKSKRSLSRATDFIIAPVSVSA